MTTTSLAIIGAAVLNVPTVLAATVLPADAFAISAVVLPATGAVLGAMLGWGIAHHSDEVAATQFEPAAIERIAA